MLSLLREGRVLISVLIEEKETAECGDRRKEEGVTYAKEKGRPCFRKKRVRGFFLI